MVRKHSDRSAFDDYCPTYVVLVLGGVGVVGGGSSGSGSGSKLGFGRQQFHVVGLNASKEGAREKAEADGYYSLILFRVPQKVLQGRILLRSVMQHKDLRSCVEEVCKESEFVYEIGESQPGSKAWIEILFTLRNPGQRNEVSNHYSFSADRDDPERLPMAEQPAHGE